MDLPRQLSGGSSTKDGTIAAIDLCLQALRPGGRAVLHLPANITCSTSGERYRQTLVNKYRVAAVIGLPSGAVTGTAIRSVHLVIDKAKPGETFVAQLGEDWTAQLAPRGAALQAALAHLDGLGGEG
jgi:type I restriction-modification system DNA methylase subunit